MAQLKLEKIIDLKKWQALQDSLAEITGLAIITVDYKGVPFSVHSKCTPFCKKVREDGVLSKNCEKCDSRAGLEAVRSNEPYIYLCHYNIIDIAIPITLEDRYVGAVMAGQVKVADVSMAPYSLERIFDSDKNWDVLGASRELQELYNRIPTLDYEKILTASNMLFWLCRYIVDEAKQKSLIMDMYETLASNGQPLSLDDVSPMKMRQVKDVLSNALNHAYLDIQNPDFSNVRNKKLIPAFELIYNSPSRIFSMSEAAEICHLSVSYFSRCFYKEVGENYTTYVAQLKIEWAKQILLGTDLSVTQVSDELGFSDPGYFIKIFKKYEAITPATYRRFIQEKM